MLAELDVVVFLQSTEDPERTAEKVFGALKTTYQQSAMEDTPGVTYYEADGLGFHAVLFSNTGDLQDPEFESYSHGLEITSHFWCVEMETADLEGALSEYYARMLAFDLNLETATEILVDTTEESEIFEIRAFRRNPQFRLDQAPTTPRVFVIETRRVEQSFEEEQEWEGGDAEPDVYEEAPT